MVVIEIELLAVCLLQSTSYPCQWRPQVMSHAIGDLLVGLDQILLRSSIELRLSASPSHSSPVPRSGMRSRSPVRIISRLVAMISSIRATERRDVDMPAAAARTKNAPAAQTRLVLIFFLRSLRSSAL